METLNASIFASIAFGLTTVLSLYLFYKATKRSPLVPTLAILWLGVQGFLALKGFYTVTDTFPPRFLLLIAPPILLIAGIFVSGRGKRFMDELDLKHLTLLHVVRIPVELVLFALYMQRLVPELMTFEGRNFDILSGVSAPLVYYMVFINKRSGHQLLLSWNFLCLLLLFNIVIHAILSLPTTFQQLAFDQPNVGVLYFPFVFLPACVVPLVLFSHLVAIRRLLRMQPGLFRPSSMAAEHCVVSPGGPGASAGSGDDDQLCR